MLRLVLDTNILVSAALNPQGAPAKVVEGFLDGRWELLVSPEVLDEYEAVLSRGKFGFAPQDVRTMMERLKRDALAVFPDQTVQACTDTADDKFVSCALAGKAEWLITGNKKHFPKSPFMGVRIVSPAEFLAEPG